ncbi:sulfatase-like hydrolase/transferase [Ruficoccus sp. ZRK36]|uniref:sulfatase-like hydrolase/transferase n=1 Tax=Ruficoccus sp. ZRK36 TaxID=2866311 RepID=UPI001C7375E5|nr:sulfatase-like hydrolase/transferase [Ruficoccus sp. ZRK36]QYY36883.1 sulfatase-like hydrolase/transferase [Ruficoccus sp. ZRK36]
MTPTPGKNIVLIVTDEQNLAECAAYGATPCKTPHLDQLAAESVLFENAYTSCPLCSPARGTVVTGLYPHAHGVTCNTEDTGCCVQELNDSPDLLPRVLSGGGYSCGFTGKWHLGTTKGNLYNNGRNPALPTDFGYEGYDYPGHGGIGIGYDQFKEHLKQHGLQYEVDRQTDMQPLIYGASNIPEALDVPAFITDQAIEMVDTFSRRDQPFFLHVNHWGPHHPFFVPEEALESYEDTEIPPWPNYEWDPYLHSGPHQLRVLPDQRNKSWDDWARLLRYKYAFTSSIDRQVGRLMRHLREQELLDNTVVIFTSDHGDHSGSHGGLIDKGFTHFEEALHIPLMIRMPDGQGKRCQDLVSLADIYATVIDAAGMSSPASHGQSLVNPALPPREHVVTEFHGLNSMTLSMRTIRAADLKYGWNCVGEDELYDLSADPHEMRNLIGDPAYAARLREMRQRLYDWMEETRDPVREQYARYNV